MIRAGSTRWLIMPLLTGRFALLCAMVAVALPTLVRAAVDGVVTGCEFTPYLPFVLVCAILLRWWQAGAVALVSVGIIGGLFGGSHAARHELLHARCRNLPRFVRDDDRDRGVGQARDLGASKSRRR